MDAADIIGKRFDELIDRRFTTNINDWSEIDHQIFYIGVAQCELNICGFASIFEQCLTAEEVRYLIATLKELDEPKLAEYFEEAYQLLANSNFYDGNEWNGSELNSQTQDRFNVIQEELYDGQALSMLDEKLAKLIVS